mmetsp:Transcript_21401/g.45450  ORF Transcript_21401/g.45450 Transcript_21401/m.45450 type:complete len:93 (+) Transcript_21401:896-1174(+)
MAKGDCRATSHSTTGGEAYFFARLCGGLVVERSGCTGQSRFLSADDPLASLVQPHGALTTSFSANQTEVQRKLVESEISRMQAQVSNHTAEN